jgi:BirA family biotin operon repressor/biotin-[acetyl-CoA-carboxylase] ligase
MSPREEWHLDTAHIGRRVLRFDTLDSTSSHAAALAADPGNAGLVVMAEAQTAGRGQYGRSWLCPERAGLLLSVLLFPPPAARRPALMTAWAAVSVCATIQHAAGVRAQIKWPNDVLIRGRKVCGILIEQGRGGAEPPAAWSGDQVVVGIGLNVLQPAEAFAAAGLPEAASLALFTDRALDRDAIARWLIAELDEGYARLCAGELGELEAEWRERLGLLGKRVTAECPGAVHRGHLRELAFDGLELVCDDGRLLRLAPEIVRHLDAE